MKALLQVRNLNVSYFLGGTRIVGVEGVDLDIGAGEILGLVGESGSGKSTLAISIIRALKPPGKVTAGSIVFQEKELLKLKDDELRSVRWKEISMVPQASQNALSPTMRVRDHFKSVMMAHGMHDRRVIQETSTRYLEEVMLEPRRVMDAFPHELSGGMKQRVLIALSLVLEPKLLILDEPTSALDLITQQTILKLIKRMHDKMGISMLFITHDLSLVSDFADRTAIMYHGKVMEIGPTHDVLTSPINPYTRALLLAIPKLHGDIGEVRPVAGNPPNPTESLPGCRFHPRCAFAQSVCKEADPPLEVVAPGHSSACHFNREMVGSSVN